MEPPHAASDNSKGTGSTTQASSVASPEPVYRFYLSPPPTAPMQPSLAPYLQQQQQQQQQQPPSAMFQAPMGMFPFATPYMSPPQAQGLSGVSAFGQPAYYAAAPQQQSMYYPSAYAMP
ncbi:hypothetical protein GGI22_002820, partial [Coemansia erecta]